MSFVVESDEPKNHGVSSVPCIVLVNSLCILVNFFFDFIWFSLEKKLDDTRVELSVPSSQK